MRLFNRNTPDRISKKGNNVLDDFLSGLTRQWNWNLPEDETDELERIFNSDENEPNSFLKK